MMHSEREKKKKRKEIPIASGRSKWNKHKHILHRINKYISEYPWADSRHPHTQSHKETENDNGRENIMNA